MGRGVPPQGLIVAELDPRTLIFITSLLGLVCVVIMFALQRSFPRGIEGLGTWAWGMLVAAGSAVLFGLRGTIPDLLSVVVANGLLAGGLVALHVALLRFAGLPRAPLWQYALLPAGMMAAVAWFTYGLADYQLRHALVAAMLMLLLGRLAIAAWRGGKGSFAAGLMAGALAFSALFSGVRLAVVLAGIDTALGLFDPSVFNKLYLAALSVTVLIATVGFMLMANERLREELEYLASHDVLSGALGRRAFLEMAEAELARSQRHGRSLSLLMIDLDHFKAVNDRYGHLVGDRVIQDFARRARDLLRRQDVLGRYGGEEFAVLLPETRLAEARNAAERIRQGLAGDDALPPYTVSIGAALAYPGMPLNALLMAADQALYRAKANGRNRVEMVEPMPAESVSAAY